MCSETAPGWKVLDVLCVFCVFEEHRRMKCGFSEENVCIGLEMRPQSMRDKICLMPLWLIYYESIMRTIVFVRSAV